MYPCELRQYSPVRILPALLLLLLLIVTSCSTNPSETSPARLQLLLTDQPAWGIELESLTIVFEQVEAHLSDPGKWEIVVPSTLPEADRTFDLLELQNGITAVLGDTILTPGHYTQLRIKITSATARIDGMDRSVTISSGTQSGLKLIHEFELREGEITSLTLDFDARQSLRQTGSGELKLQPTIRVVATVLSGSISGTVSPTGIGALVHAAHLDVRRQS